MADLQAEIEILSRSGMGSTRKKVPPAQKKWLNTQSSANTSTRLILRIQFTSGINASPNDKTITNQFRVLTMAELQPDIEILSRSGMGSTRKKVPPAQKKWLNTQSSANTSTRLIPRIQFTSGINASPNDKTITNQFRVLTMAELQPDIEILSRSGMGSTRKKVPPAQKKWLNTQSSANTSTRLIPRIQFTSGINASPNDKTITNQFRVLTMAELQPDIEILSRSGMGSTRKKVPPAQKKWLNTQSSANTSTRLIPRIQFTSGINASPNDKTITNQFRVLTMAELQPDIEILSRSGMGSTRKKVPPAQKKWLNTQSSANTSTRLIPRIQFTSGINDAKPKIDTNSAPKRKSIMRRSVGKRETTSKRDVGRAHSKTRKVLTFGPEISKIPQFQKDKSSSSSDVSTKGIEIRDFKTVNGNQITKYSLSKSQSEKWFSPPVTDPLNIKLISETLSETSRISGVNFCPQSPVISNIAQVTISNNQSKRILNENKGGNQRLANPELSRISESPTVLRLSKGDTTSNSDESFLAREKEIYCNVKEVDGGDKSKVLTPENQNLGKLLDISFDADDTLCFENSLIHKPDPSNGNTDYRGLQVRRKMEAFWDKFKKDYNKAKTHKQRECFFFKLKSKLETDRRIFLRQIRKWQYHLNYNQEMLDAMDDIMTHYIEDEAIVLDEAAKSPKPEENTEQNTISDPSTPPSSKSKSNRQRNSPVFVIPKKTSCLRKKILRKSFSSESQMMSNDVTDDQVENKPLAMYMKMKESWTFLQTPNKPNFNINTQNLTQSSPVISLCLQRQLDKLYGKGTS